MIYTDTKVIRTTLHALETKKRLLVEVGGTNSGKTFGIMAALVLYALAQTVKKKITIVAVNFPYIRRDSLKCFHEIVADLGIEFTKKSITNSTFHIGKCEFEFIGMEDPAKASHGKRDILYINEAYLVPYMVYKNLSIRTTYTTIVDFNPHEDFWLQETVIPNIQPGTYQFVRTTYKDNPAVSEKIVQDIEALKTENPNLYNVLGLGLTGKLEGLIYPNFERCDRFPRDCKRHGYGMDFGFANDPTALIHAGVYNGDLYLEEIIYEKGMLLDPLTNKMIEEQITERDLIKADPSSADMIAELKERGFNISAADFTSGKGALSYRINLINGYKIFIVKSSINLIKEQKNYRWKVDKNGKSLNVPIDQYNHAWDGISYIAIDLLKPKIYHKRSFSTA